MAGQQDNINDRIEKDRQRIADDTLREVWPLMDAVVKANKSGPRQRETSEIPELDLQGNLMAKQRKVSATRRTGPGKKGSQVVDLSQRHTSNISSWRMSVPSIISEIVSRDIDKFCRNPASQAG